MSVRHTYIDLFAGCGGLSDGFEATDLFEGLAHVEWERAPCDTLVQRLADKWGYKDAHQRVLQKDMQDLENLLEGKYDLVGQPCKPLTALAGNRTSKVDLVIGGPPCQAYSIAGRVRDAHGMQLDYRNYLFESYLAVVKRFLPDVIVFENVVGMLSARPGGVPIVDRIRSSFVAAGYDVVGDLQNATIDLSDYGVPQHRTRVILVGLRREAFGAHRTAELLRQFYSSTLRKQRARKKRTALDAIGSLPPLTPAVQEYKWDGRLHSHAPYATNKADHQPRYHNRRDIQTFRLLAEDLASGRGVYESVDALKRLYTERTGRTSEVHKYFVIRPDAPSNTIPAHLYKDGLRHIHWDPNQARSITVREAARLQGFPDSFRFRGSVGDHYKMIGNAVPPVFAEKLAVAISTLLAERRGRVRPTQRSESRLESLSA